MSVAEQTPPAMHPDADPYAMNIDDIDPSVAEIFEEYKHHKFFERLRKDDPVHFNENEMFGRFWSITRFKDIMAVDTNHKVFSSEPSIFLQRIDIEEDPEFNPETFIAMDEPRHSPQRRAVTPAVDPPRVAELEDLIRERTAEVLDNLPVGETFNWVEEVSIELTTRMLATLFDFPFEDRRKLTRWSDLTTTPPEQMGMTPDEVRAELLECLEYFGRLWVERSAPDYQGKDFITLMAHDENTKTLEPMQILGNLLLLIVGGNDTTRNSMSASVHLMHQFPEEFAKIKANPDLIPNMVSEVIRYQTPLGYMRRTALEDFEMHGKTIKKGDVVVMWYVSGNRDETEIEDPDKFLVDRQSARRHLSFGYGIHRCMGNRIGELQVKVLWEEILKRFDRLEVVGAPSRTKSNFVMGYKDVEVKLHPKT